MYGLLAWTVNERRRELAIRLALGAQPGALARLVTAQGLMLALLGVVLGLAGAQFARGLLRDVLFETRPTDLLALTSAAGVLVLAAAARLPRARPARDAGESYGGDEVSRGAGARARARARGATGLGANRGSGRGLKRPRRS